MRTCAQHSPIGDHVETFDALKPFDRCGVDFLPRPQRPDPGHEVPTIGLIHPEHPELEKPAAADI